MNHASGIASTAPEFARWRCRGCNPASWASVTPASVRRQLRLDRRVRGLVGARQVRPDAGDLQLAGALGGQRRVDQRRPVGGERAAPAQPGVELELDAGSPAGPPGRLADLAQLRHRVRRHLDVGGERGAVPLTGHREPGQDRTGVTGGAQPQAPPRAARHRASRHRLDALRAADSTIPWPYPSAFTTAIRSRSPPTCRRSAAVFAVIADRSTTASARPAGSVSGPVATAARTAVAGSSGAARCSAHTPPACAPPRGSTVLAVRDRRSGRPG